MQWPFNRRRPFSEYSALSGQIAAGFAAQNQRMNQIMAKIEDIVADEAKLKVSNGQLIQLAGNTLAALKALQANPGIDPTTQAQIDQLHTDLTADLADVTAALTADGTPVEPPAPAPVPDTSGATGNTPTA